MRLLFLLLASLFFLSTAMSPEEFPIKKWVILMMENRSFDHLLGHLKKTNPEVDGLTGKESNPVNPFDPNSPKVFVTFDAPPIDPNADHSVPGTTDEIFGGANMTNLNPAPMNGFYACAEKIQPGWGKDVLSAFNAKTLPVLSTLANEFLVIDKWFSSIPGPTEVNRAYLMSASSHGTANNDPLTLAEGFPQDCFQPLLSAAGYDWKVFFEFFPTALFMRQLRSWPTHFHSYWDFETLAASGDLPTYTFLEPRYYSITSELPANDQHPDHNIQDGEELIKWTYEKLRASPSWNETAFIILYDEHGGMYDHVPTPLNVPNPDGKVSTDPAFDFKRIGVRVPAVIVSPWVNKGTVEHEPKGPFPDSQYEHSSVISTISKVLGINKHLTKRDEWAGTFEHVFLNRTSPRTDCPTTLPSPPKTRTRKNMMEQPLNELQTNILAVAAHMNGLDHTEVLKTVRTEKQGGEFVAEMMNKYLVRATGKGNQ